MGDQSSNIKTGKYDKKTKNKILCMVGIIWDYINPCVPDFTIYNWSYILG